MSLETLCVKTEAEEVHVKEEAEEVCENGETGANVKVEAECEENADLSNLYVGHQVKDELMLGPEELHRPCATSAPPVAPNKAEEACGRAGSVKLENQVVNARRVGIHTYTLRTTHKPPSKYTDTSSIRLAPSYRCNKCAIVFKKKADLRKHEYTHVSETVSQYPTHFACNQCNAKFKSELLVTEHKKKDHGVLTVGFMCFDCNYRTSNKCRFETHLNLHTLRQYKCIHCNYRSPHKCALDLHLIVHNRLYKCYRCNYKTEYESELLSHRKTHGIKPFKCCYCNYKCRYRTELQRHQERHIMIHTTRKQLKRKVLAGRGGQ